MQSVGFFKRLFVVLYDSLLLAGVIFAASVLFLLIPDSVEFTLIVKLVKLIYLLAVTFAFYGWFWVKAGQTLGMKAWGLYLINSDGKFINWKQAAIRYVAAILSWAALGLGFTWILINKRQLAWHDMISKSQIVKATAIKKK